MDVDVLSIPVGLVCLENDGIFSSCVGNNVRTAVCDGVGVLAIGIGFVFGVEISAELAAHGLIEGSAHRSEHAITKEGHEEGARSLEGVLNSTIVNCLDADFREVVNLSVDVSVSVHDSAAIGTDKVFQTAHSVHHVLHAGNKVVSNNGSNLTALGVDPYKALTEGKGVNGAVFGNFVALSQCGLESAFAVILIQAVIGVDDCLGVSRTGGSQNVPSLRIAGIAHGEGVLQGVALAGQVFLYPILVGAGAPEFIPLFLHLGSFGSQDGQLAVYNNVVVETFVVVAPLSVAVAIGSNAANGKVTAVGGQGEHNAGLQQLCLGNCHQSKTHGLVFLLQSFHVDVIELTKSHVVQIRRSFIIAHRGDVNIFAGFTGGIGCRGSIRCIGCSCFFRAAAANKQAGYHAERQKKCNQFLHFQTSIFNIFHREFTERITDYLTRR